MKWLCMAIALFGYVGSALAERPNILWIEADSLTPRFMNKLGGGFGYTPSLDRLAESGTCFPNAVCQEPMCGLSAMASCAGCPKGVGLLCRR
jgi:arylsulfatase A-like enzyme